MSKTFWAIVVVGIIIIGVIIWYGVWGSAPAPVSDQNNMTANTVSGQPMIPAYPSNSSSNSSMSAATDTSDAALDQDSAAIDSQMNGLNSDSANASADQSASTQ